MRAGASPIAEDHLLAAVSATVAEHRTATVDLATLRMAAIRADASIADTDGRGRLAAVLTRLADDGIVTLPKGASGWDTGPGIPLPLKIIRARTKTLAPVIEVPQSVRAALGPSRADRLDSLPHLRQEELAILTDVTEWLRSHAGTAMTPLQTVPARERALQVFGDEKRLDALVRSRLFTTGVLDLDLLGAEIVPVPFVSVFVPGRQDSSGLGRPTTGVGPGITCVVAENHHTWVSLLRDARAREIEHTGLHIGWGGGGQFHASVTAVRLLEPAVSTIAYFGDLDDRGLSIPAAAHAVTTRENLPPVVPAAGLYRLLLATGRRQHTGKPLPADLAAQRSVWLGPLAPAAVELLTSGVRLAQEAVGTQALGNLQVSEWL